MTVCSHAPNACFISEIPIDSDTAYGGNNESTLKRCACCKGDETPYQETDVKLQGNIWRSVPLALGRTFVPGGVCT